MLKNCLNLKYDAYMKNNLYELLLIIDDKLSAKHFTILSLSIKNVNHSQNFIELSNYLNKNDQLVQLNFTFNDTDVYPLFGFLKTNKNIKTLKLIKKYLGMDVCEIEELIKVLKCNETLDELHFNTLSRLGIKAMLDFLETNKTLKKINFDIPLNYFHEIKKYIFDVIKINTSLIEFKIGFNHVHELFLPQIQYYFDRNSVLSVHYNKLKLPKCIVKKIFDYVIYNKKLKSDCTKSNIILHNQII
jgi:hypothetical protein